MQNVRWWFWTLKAPTNTAHTPRKQHYVRKRVRLRYSILRETIPNVRPMHKQFTAEKNKWRICEHTNFLSVSLGLKPVLFKLHCIDGFLKPFNLHHHRFKMFCTRTSIMIINLWPALWATKNTPEAATAAVERNQIAAVHKPMKTRHLEKNYIPSFKCSWLERWPIWTSKSTVSCIEPRLKKQNL